MLWVCSSNNVLFIFKSKICLIYVIFHLPWIGKGWHTDDRFDLFLYLPMNRMFVTTGTEFSQFQPTRRIVSILLSNISGNPHWFLINTVSNTTSTFQNNCYSGIFTLGHEPPLDFWFTQLFHFPIQNEEKKKEKKISW